jgi:hypothetical protein
MNRGRPVCRSTRAHALTTLVIAGVSVLAFSGTAWAQLKGHYIPGFTGLDNGSQPPPSITFAVPVYVYPTDTIKDDNGNTVGGQPQITASFTGLSVIVVTNAKLFGANYGFQVVPVDWMKSRIEARSLDVPGSFAFSDLTVAPLWLGWHKPRADFVAGWSVFIPTGKWELGGTDNSGLGMWSNDFQFGSTIHLDDKHAWTTALLGTYEVHSHKKDSVLRAGGIFTLEGGTGKAFYRKVSGTPLPQMLSVGVAYYAQMKVTSDTGTGPIADELVAGLKDHVFGIGGEMNVFLPKPKLLLGVRLVPEFGARNRTQGLTFLFTIGYQAKSLVKMP